MIPHNPILKKFLKNIHSTKSVNDIKGWIVKIAILLVTFGVFYIIFKILFKKEEEKSIVKDDKQQKLYNYFFKRFIFTIILIIVFIFISIKLGFNLGTILVILSTIGLAIALSFQELLKQIVAGIVIMSVQYYNINDIIKVNESIGFVKDFNLLYTTVKTSINETIMIPNNIILSGTFTNLSVNEDVFLSITIALSNNNPGINYEILLEKMKIMIGTIPFITDKTSIKANVDDMSNTGTKLFISAKVKGADYFKTRRMLNLKCREFLQREKVKLLDNCY